MTSLVILSFSLNNICEFTVQGMVAFEKQDFL
jgi:hypothetical protein